MSGEPRSVRREAFPSVLALLLAVISLGVGFQLVAAGGRNSVGGGVLLLVAALAFTALSLAQGPYGPDSEGALDLSARLGLGFLGGLLGALAVRLTVWLTAGVGLLSLLGLRLGSWEDATGLGLATGPALLWGVAGGVLYPYIPGREFPAKGAAFGVLAALYVLFKTLPFDLASGWLGVEFGRLAFVPVILLGLIWGITCTATVSWGARSDQAPVSRPLG